MDKKRKEIEVTPSTSSTTTTTTNLVNESLKKQKQKETDEEKLKRYLTVDLKTVRTPDELIEQVMKPLAKNLMNKVVMEVGRKTYRITDIEFNINTPYHNDAYTTNEDEKLKFGRWFFHKSQSNGAFKTGTSKGLDITLGDGVNHASVSIKAMTFLPGMGEYSGPSMQSEGQSSVVDVILMELGPYLKEVDPIATLYHGVSVIHYPNSSNPFKSSSRFCIRPYRDLEKTEMCRSSRIGLSLKSPREDAYRYFSREYRFCLSNLVKRGKHPLWVCLHRQGITVEQIRKLTRGSPASAVEVSIGHFERGKKLTKADLVNYKKALGEKNDILCQAIGLCSKLDIEELEKEKEKEVQAKLDSNECTDDDDKGSNDSPSSESTTAATSTTTTTTTTNTTSITNN